MCQLSFKRLLFATLDRADARYLKEVTPGSQGLLLKRPAQVSTAAQHLHMKCCNESLEETRIEVPSVFRLPKGGVHLPGFPVVALCSSSPGNELGICS